MTGSGKYSNESAGADRQVDHLRREVVLHAIDFGGCLSREMNRRTRRAVQIQSIAITLNNSFT